MIEKEDKDFIENCFLTLQKNHPEKFYIPSDFYRDIPEEMRSDEKNKWKLIKSTVSEKDIFELEKKFEIKLPEIYKVFISSYFYLFDKLKGVVDEYDYDVTVDIMNQTPDEPLGEIYHIFNEFEGILKFGYIPIGDFNDIGPLCFDALNNYQIIWFDHEEYYRCTSREELEDIAILTFDNFKSFMKCFFCDIEYISEEM